MVLGCPLVIIISLTSLQFFLSKYIYLYYCSAPSLRIHLGILDFDTAVGATIDSLWKSHILFSDPSALLSGLTRQNYPSLCM
jgi:hypothetical protein